MKKIKQFLARKALGSLGSATMGVAAAIVAVGAWVQMHPDVLSTLVSERYRGLALALVGVVVALARLRTVGK